MNKSTIPQPAISQNPKSLVEAEQVLTQLASVFFSGDVAQRQEPVTTGEVDTETKYKTLVEQIPAVVFMAFLDRGLSEAYVSPHIESILGFTQKEWLDDPVRWYWQIHPEDRDRWNVEAANMLLTDTPLRSVYRVLSRDDGVVWFQCEATMVRRESGEPWFIHGIAFDISDLKRTEQALQQTLDELEERVVERTAALANTNRDLELEIAERSRMERERAQLLIRERQARKEAETANLAKDEFLATISHELRTPMNVIIGWTHMLRTVKMDEAMYERALEVVDRSARAQSKLIEDLLDVSSMIAGKLRLELQPLDPVAVMEGAFNSLVPAATEKGVELIKILDSNTGPLLGDSGRLQQIIFNLLTNAIKFTPSGGKVTLRLLRIDSTAEIIISDTGEGISADILPHIFERFRQADSSFTRKHGGLGLGLAIVRHIVEMHGGQVLAESAGLGQGSTFTVRLPILGVSRKVPMLVPEAITEAFEMGHIPALEGLKVLVVDDEKDTTDMIRTALIHCGAKVTTAHSASTALEIFQKGRPDVMISDIGMPGEDGFSLIAKIRALTPEQGGSVPAVALTAHARSEDRMKALASGFQMHVPKPVELAELIVVLASVTHRTKFN